MITRPHICLRYQLRLAKRSTLSRTQRACQSTDDKPSRWQGAAEEDQDEQEFHHTKRPLRLSRRPLSAQYDLSEHPLGKLYGYTGQQLRENRETLPVNVLGKATEVIVLKDSRITKKIEPIEEDTNPQTSIDILAKIDEEDTNPQTSIDILAKIDEERGLVAWDEVEFNINDFKPNQGDVPTTNVEFGQLLIGLQGGFTAAQLARYIKANSKTDKKSPTISSTSPIIYMTPWVPGFSNSDEPLDLDNLRGYDLESYTSKQRLVLRILRECWNLRLQFVEEGLGQIEVELRLGHLELLLKDKTYGLSAIQSRHMTERDERLESFRINDDKHSRNAIRITTRRNKGYAVVRDIEETLRNIHRIELSLESLFPQADEDDEAKVSKWLNTHFGDAVIADAARLTNTDIRRSRNNNGNTLFISCLEPSTGSLANRTDVARRLLVSSAFFASQKRTVRHEELPGTANGSMVQYPMIEGLYWRDRLLRWARWTSPVTKEAEAGASFIPDAEKTDDTQGSKSIVRKSSGGHHDPTTDASHAVPSKAERRRRSIDVLKLGSTAYWDSPDDFGLQSSATMGHVLHNHSAGAITPLQESVLSLGSTRTFSNKVTNLSKILTSAYKSSSGVEETVVMRFLPDPFTSNASQSLFNHSTYPPVEVRFNVDSDTKELHLHSVLALISTETSDLMLPNSPTDIRFQQRITAALHVARDNLPEGLARFCEQSSLTLDFAIKGSLAMPPSLSLPCPPPHPHWKRPGTPDTKNGSETQIEYLFAGLEIHKTLPLEFEGWRLLYTSIEAGKAGGRRSELQLRRNRVKGGDDLSKNLQEAFIESAFRLADSKITPTQVRKEMGRIARFKASSGTYARPVTRIFRFFARRPSDFNLPEAEDEWMTHQDTSSENEKENEDL